jgi:peptidoglycan hydrolase-like protein with peptidoglycan-binding domain
MYIFTGSLSDLRSYVRDEVEFPGETARGKRGNVAKRIQEWLCLNGYDVVVDEDFGVVTEGALKEFQTTSGLAGTGVLDQTTHQALVAPMLRALSPATAGDLGFGAAVAAIGGVHLAEHPREAGGDNLGPWVRLYMDGNEGAAWFWCAGFVTFLMKQAAEALGASMPIAGSFSCDSLAAQAKAADLFMPGLRVNPTALAPGSIFLVRRTSSDWTHTGIVTRAEADVFHTVEGNTNDDGNRNGYEVCTRRRGYAGKDFIVFQPAATARARGSGRRAA